jgi:pyrimidine operon attenuation protein / uracil phosphoribosyltransferase
MHTMSESPAMPAELDAEALLASLTEQLRTYLTAEKILRPLMIGVHSGGAWLAARMHAALGLESPLGSLNIGFYRDDFAQSGLSGGEAPSHLPIDISHRDVILVDDILFTGRTVRAAMNELFDFGRPNSIRLVCLVARDGRQLPVQPDVCAARVQLAANEVIKLRGPTPLRLQRHVRTEAV